MEHKEEKVAYKKITLGMFETNDQGYKRLIQEFITKLDSRMAADRDRITQEQLGDKLESDVLIEFDKKATQVLLMIDEYQKYSKPDAIQVLGCVGRALENPNPQNMEQVNLLIADLSKFRASDEKQAAAAQKRHALVVGISSLIFYLAIVTAAIMFPPSIPVLLVVAASVVLPGGYFYAKSNIKQARTRDANADVQGKASSELIESMKVLKEALPRPAPNDIDPSISIDKKPS